MASKKSEQKAADNVTQVPDSEIWDPFRKYLAQWKAALKNRVNCSKPITEESFEAAAEWVNPLYFPQNSNFVDWTEEEIVYVNSKPLPQRKS